MEYKQLSWRQRGRLWMRLGIRLLLAVAVVLAVVKLGPPLLKLFFPFVLALAAAAALNPLVRWAQKKLGWSRKLLSLLLLLLILGLLGGGVTLLLYAAGREVLALAQNWEGLMEQFQTAVTQLEQLFAWWLSLLPEAVTQFTRAGSQAVLAWLEGTVHAGLLGAAEYLKDKAIGVPAFFLALVMFVLATYFLTADYPYLRTRLMQHMDQRFLSLCGQVRSTALVAFGGYLKAQVLLSVGVFVILLAGFLLTGQSYALLLALGLAVLDFIPIVGSGTVMVPWAVVAFIIRDYPTAISVMVIWGVIVLYRRVAEPKVVGDQTGLSPILSLVSIYVGMRLAGVPGMILGPILTLVVLNLSGIGMFHSLRRDLAAAVEDVLALLAQTTEDGQR